VVADIGDHRRFGRSYVADDRHEETIMNELYTVMSTTKSLWVILGQLCVSVAEQLSPFIGARSDSCKPGNVKSTHASKHIVPKVF